MSSGAGAPMQSLQMQQPLNIQTFKRSNYIMPNDKN